MTLDEAIKMCENVVIFSSKEYEQLAEWLEDYKKLKSIDEDLRLKYCYEDLSEADNLGYLRGYNKAISEVDDLLSADLPISNVLHNINEFILINNKGINYDDLDTDKECAE